MVIFSNCAVIKVDTLVGVEFEMGICYFFSPFVEIELFSLFLGVLSLHLDWLKTF